MQSVKPCGGGSFGRGDHRSVGGRCPYGWRRQQGQGDASSSDDPFGCKSRGSKGGASAEQALIQARKREQRNVDQFLLKVQGIEKYKDEKGTKASRDIKTGRGSNRLMRSRGLCVCSC